jgi:hypothetical protein
MTEFLFHRRSCAVSQANMRCFIYELVCFIGEQQYLYLSSLSLCLVLIDRVWTGRRAHCHESLAQHLCPPSGGWWLGSRRAVKRAFHPRIYLRGGARPVWPAAWVQL